MSGLTDRELLEGAARAAGFQLDYLCDMPHMIVEEWSGDPSQHPEQRAIEWNPLNDDGDALRLAAQLNLGLVTDDRSICAKTITGVEPRGCASGGGEHRSFGFGEKMQIIRRCIVRAAYEIGSARRYG
jgi:hypothetical protein